MSLSAKIRRAPVRLVTGAYILNSGLGKFGGDEDVAKGTHGMASNAYPFLENVDSKLFLRALAAGEVALGAAVLLPIVPAAAAGAGLMAFSGALLGMYWRTPHLHRPNDPRPTAEGVSVAKDAWMFGIGSSLLLDAMTDPVHDKRIEVTHQLKEITASNTGKVKGLAAVAPVKAKETASVSTAKAKEAAATNAAKAMAVGEAARSMSRRAAKRARKQTAAARKQARKHAERANALIH
jgi:uncharacterized membrane protein YphA (DoxX/SURF4 family)